MSNTLITWAAFYPSLGGHIEAVGRRPEKICQAPGLRASTSAVARRSSARPAKTSARAQSLACNNPVNVFN